MIPGWSKQVKTKIEKKSPDGPRMIPDGTIQRAQHEQPHQILHWARQVHGSCSESSILTVFVWVQLQPIGQVFFRADCFWHIFDFLDFKSSFYGKTAKN